MNRNNANMAVMTILSIGNLFGGGGGIPLDLQKTRVPKTRPCKNCGKPHHHNNCCCSAACYKEWKSNANQST